MKKIPKINSLIPYLAIFLFWLGLLLVSFFRNNSDVIEKYNLTEGSLTLIQATVSLPNLVIWFAVVFAVTRFKKYSNSIKNSNEGKAFNQIANSLVVTLGGMLVAGFITQLKSNAISSESSSSSYVSSITIINVYVAVIVALISYSLLFSASTKLHKTLGTQTPGKNFAILGVVFAVIIGSVYSLFVFNNEYRTTSNNPEISATYALNDILIALTVIVPYVISWFLAYQSLVKIHLYQKLTKGIIYKRLLRNFTRGISLIVSMSIVLQIITQFSEYWASTGLTSILAIIAVIYVVLITGYLMIGRSAKQLNAIEKV